MNRLLLFPLFILFSCSGNQVESSFDSWTENQEINFYIDCKEKMKSHGENEENAQAFCECCLLKLKDLYSNGKEAMDNLTDTEIEKIEGDCSDKLSN